MYQMAAIGLHLGGCTREHSAGGVRWLQEQVETEFLQAAFVGCIIRGRIGNKDVLEIVWSQSASTRAVNSVSQERREIDSYTPLYTAPVSDTDGAIANLRILVDSPSETRFESIFRVWETKPGTLLE
jgi:hypothetical protein